MVAGALGEGERVGTMRLMRGWQRWQASDEPRSREVASSMPVNRKVASGVPVSRDDGPFELIRRPVYAIDLKPLTTAIFLNPSGALVRTAVESYWRHQPWQRPDRCDCCDRNHPCPSSRHALEVCSAAGIVTPEGIPARLPWQERDDSTHGVRWPEPAATDPAATEPTATEPTATEPGADVPAATDPATTDPGADDPVAADDQDGAVRPAGTAATGGDGGKARRPARKAAAPARTAGTRGTAGTGAVGTEGRAPRRRGSPTKAVPRKVAAQAVAPVDDTGGGAADAVA